MNKKELGQKIFSTSYLKGQFKLRSGLSSQEYFDKYHFESTPFLLKEVAKHLSNLIPTETEVLAGLELGGVPLVTALSFETGLPSVFVRKKAKNYGTCKIAEGVEIYRRKLCVVEDVVTTGGQVLKSVEDLRKEKAIVETVLTVLLRGEFKKVHSLMKKASLNFSFLFEMKELKKEFHKT